MQKFAWRQGIQTKPRRKSELMIQNCIVECVLLIELKNCRDNSFQLPASTY